MRTGPDFLLPLWRALVVYRLVTWAVAVGSFALAWERYPRILPGLILLAVMAAWTAVVTVVYSTDGGRRARMASYDLVVTLLIVAAALFTQPWSALADGAPIITSLWGTGPIFALALERGVTGGLVGALLVSAENIAMRQGLGDQESFNTTLHLVAGLSFGYAVTATRKANEALREALAAEGAAAERERLSRSIHDGVLQVLAIVRRNGAEIGGRAAELSALAGEQEIALRTLMTSRPASADGHLDLAATLRGHAGAKVAVSAPAGAVMLTRDRVAEVDAVVAELLNNVTEHAGPHARAWVSLEDLGEQVLVSVRDDGPGIEASRLDRARAEGHLGISSSIQGRIGDLGGTAALVGADGEGAEWELTFPKETR